MKLKGIELKGTYKVVYYDTSFMVHDERDNMIYYESSNGYWAKYEYNEKGNTIYYENSKNFWGKNEYNEKGNLIYFEDSNGFWSKREYDEKDNVIYFENSNSYWTKRKYDEKDNMIYFEDSNGYWAKWEYDKKGDMIYFEDSDGGIIDKRVKELTIEEIEKLLGYKIKIKGNEDIDKNMNAGQEDAVFYGAIRGSEKADDILFALQVVYGEPKYTYSDLQKMNLSQTEINEALEYVEKKGYNKFSYFNSPTKIILIKKGDNNMKEKKITIWENHKQVAMFYASTKKEVFEKIKSLGLLGKGAILVQNNRKEEV